MTIVTYNIIWHQIASGWLKFMQMSNSHKSHSEPEIIIKGQNT